MTHEAGDRERMLEDDIARCKHAERELLRRNDELSALNRSLERRVQDRVQQLSEVHALLDTAHDKLKHNLIVLIKLFSSLLELRSDVLAGHSRRVADLARRIGLRMGLDAVDVNHLMLAGLLHDLGKMAWPDELLSTPLNQMSTEQLTWVRKHPGMGQTALMALEPMAEPAKLIRAHHERFDGHGYPDQLIGTEIALGARILAVANDFDGLQIGIVNTVRFTPEEAAAAIAQDRGRRYDPDVVNVFLALIEEERTLGPKEVVLRTTQLKPGMVLAHDLLSTKGVLLLAADYALSDSLISQLRELEALDGVKLKLPIRGDSLRGMR
ncbi:HD-GYP domain-containing protein [Burkholderia sp. L27(2015)]|uniref:HD-GYP domain-containing protein n=1 Tax=Burkholderia sp. L27(2015) TaxID=1641858 RepID=UPI00131C7BBB|nr:HD domain-containing phosphohydrolase [Burkholderia sp. L27(2015)]